MQTIKFNKSRCRVIIRSMFKIRKLNETGVEKCTNMKSISWKSGLWRNLIDELREDLERMIRNRDNGRELRTRKNQKVDLHLHGGSRQIPIFLEFQAKRSDWRRCLHLETWRLQKDFSVILRTWSMNLPMKSWTKRATTRWGLLRLHIKRSETA